MVEKKSGCLGGCLTGIGGITVGIVGVIVLIGIAAIALSGASDSETSDNGPSLNSQGTPQDAQPGSSENPVPVGDAATGDGLEITVNSAALSDTAGVLAGAEPGVMYLTLDVTIRNVSDDEKSFNSLYWSAKDMINGYAFDDDPFAGDSVNSFPSGDLQPDDLIRGEVVIRVRDDSERIRIKYDTAPFGGTELFWLFQST